MPLSNTITFGSLVLDGGTSGIFINSLSAERVAGSLKSVFNENVSITEVPGRAKEWLVNVSGVLSGGNREGDLNTLEGYNVGSVRNFNDGDHDGDYIILVLNVTRVNTEKTIIRYNLTIREYTQT